MDKELIQALRAKAEALLHEVENFIEIINTDDEPYMWRKGGNAIWQVDDATKELVKAAWEYDRDWVYYNG